MADDAIYLDMRDAYARFCGYSLPNAAYDRPAILGLAPRRWPTDASVSWAARPPAIEAFETLASERVTLGDQHAAAYDHLMHPVHQRGRAFAWEIWSRAGAGSASNC